MDCPPIEHVQMVTTSQGEIACIDTGGKKFSVVLVHGNSCSLKVFHKQIAALKGRYRIIAIDLPGHGQSSLPLDSDATYTIPGYAEVLDEVLLQLDIGPFALIGYSLGGNIALQYSQIRERDLRGIMLIASAPMKYSEEAMIAYPPYEGSYSAHPEQLTEEQAKQYMTACGLNVEDPAIYFMLEDAMKTDGAARAKMVTSVLAGEGLDETQIVRFLSIPLAVVAGEKEIINLEYVAALKYRNLWREKVQVIPHATHQVMLNNAEQLQTILDDFLNEMNPLKD